MNAAVVTLVVLCGMLFLTFGITLLFGRGLSLMAGYNAMSERQKQKYGKSMRIINGTGSVIVGLALIIGTLAEAISLFIGISGGLIIGLITFTLVCVSHKKMEGKMTPREKAERLHKRVNTFILSCVGSDGYPLTKAVVPGKYRESLREIYFCTNTPSKFVSEVSKNPKLNVYF